ncbi:MAG: glycoside hydrolase family 36 protein [Acutalibacteraceae bacterium]
MNNYKIKIDYSVEGKNYVTDLFETEHFKIDVTEKTDGIKFVLTPDGIAVEEVKFSVSVPYVFNSNKRVFLNGYQSWTDCREYLTDEDPLCLSSIRETVLKHTVLGASGDYTFKKYDGRKGVFHGYSYAYIRDGENYDLFGSLNEKYGYTVINAICPENEIIFERDMEGVKINSPYTLLDIAHFKGTENEVFDKYFSAMNVAKPVVQRANGYTTWYNYYSNINETVVLSDLEALSKLDAKIDFFQIDDGYQTAVGDWLSVDSKKFPHGMKHIADKIHEKGMKAGIWLAPLGCQYKSVVAKQHPDWLIRDSRNRPVKCGANWGGFYALDIENEEVREYIRNYFNVILNEWGYDMVKLDFLYAACIIPCHGKSRGQLMCEAMDFIRECVGDKLILGCGVPLAPAFGKVDYCRIGADMGLKWSKKNWFHREDVSTQNALANSIFRRQLDGRAFCNDPDVFILRDNNLHFSVAQRKIIANVNHIFGSLLFTSDNIDEYDKEKRDIILYIFNNTKPDVISAEFIKPGVLEIKYKESEELKSLCFDLKKGGLMTDRF